MTARDDLGRYADDGQTDMAAALVEAMETAALERGLIQSRTADTPKPPSELFAEWFAPLINPEGDSAA